VTESAPVAGGSADGSGDWPDGARLRIRRRRVRIWLVIGGLVVLLVAAALWIGLRALAAKDSLDEAQVLIGTLRTTVGTDPSRAPAIAARIERETGDARDLTSDPVWRGAEALPVLGKNLAVVRELAAAVDDVASGAITPLAAVAPALDPSALKPSDGRIDLAPLTEAAEPVARADAALQKAAAEVRAIDADGAVAQVADAQGRLAGLLDEGARLTRTARLLVQLLPPMLGGEAPRNYLLVVQNPAEARSLGGNAGTLLLMRAEGGAVSVVRQAASTDFPPDIDPPVTLDPNLTKVYYPEFPRYVQDIATRPDFPTMATLASGWWQREYGDAIDGVVSVDPIVLGYLLKATGPIDLPTGDRLTSDNAVRLLLSDVYAKYPEPTAQDAFFAAAAGSVFQRLLGGDIDPASLVDGLGRAADERRLMIWSAADAEESMLRTSAVGGVLPDSNDESTTLGVFFDDQSASKIDYWVDTAVDVSRTSDADGSPVYSVTWTLRSRLTPEQAAALPDYVVSQWAGPQLFRTDVYVLGPVGASSLDVTVQTPGLTNESLADGEDLGRPIVRLATNLSPGGTTSVTVRFRGDAGDAAPLALVTTPMVNPTTVTVDGAVDDRG
jgi:hypothetical protein